MPINKQNSYQKEKRKKKKSLKFEIQFFFFFTYFKYFHSDNASRSNNQVFYFKNY